MKLRNPDFQVAVIAILIFGPILFVASIQANNLIQQMENLYYATPVVDLALMTNTSGYDLILYYIVNYNLKLESVKIADHNVTILLRSKLRKGFVYKTYEDVLTTRKALLVNLTPIFGTLVVPLHIEGNDVYNVSVYCDGILGAKAELVTGSKLRNIQVNLTTTLR